LWVDVVIPPTDDLWVDDVGRSFAWLGAAWVAALAELGVGGRAHEGGLCTTQWSRLVCFGGLGPGEVVDVGERAAKIVGMAQRRGRSGARFQCAVHRLWDPGSLLAVLALPEDERSAATEALAGAVVEVDAAPASVVDALVRHLPG
jgi:hypothetical protein